jgi:hypothetical protein
MTILYEDEWVTVTFDPASSLLRYTRTAQPYANLGQLSQSFANVGAAPIPRGPAIKLLIDVRLAPPRNDAGFESKANGALETFLRLFGKHATLVRTAVGKLQTARLARERGTEARAFDDEAQALAYLGITSK